jgi:hypothetical protein
MYSVVMRVLWFALVVGVPAAALGQGLPTSQPEYLQIIREDVKVGRGAEHAKVEAGWAAAYERSKSADYYLGMTSLTSTEAWFVLPSSSFKAMGEAMARDNGPVLGPELDRLRRADGELVSGWRGVLLRARPDLSGGTYPDIGKQRHWNIGVFRMRPGGQQVFADIAKAYGSAAQRAGRTIGFRVYEVAAGMPTPTYFVFSSVQGFGDFDTLHDQDVATLGEMLKGADEKMMATWNEKLINAENFVLSLNAELSYVPADVRAADPAFWGKKPASPKAAPAKPAPTQ